MPDPLLASFSPLRPATLSDELPAMAASQEAYEALFRRWEKTGQRRAVTLEAYWRVLARFGRFLGWKALPEIRRRDLLAFRDGLLDKGLSLNTVTNQLGILRGFFRVAVDYEWLSLNPAERLNLPRQKRRKARLAFAPEDLNRLFRSPIYSAGLRPLGAGREAAFWLPLLALFTGARIEELAQLTVADIRHAPGLGHYLDIHDGGHRQLKNAASQRRIPLHGELLACGFLDYAARLPVEAHTSAPVFLFPDLKLNIRGRRGGYFSNYFSGYLRRVVGIKDRRKVFHSFRHTFKDACRAAGIDEEVHDALTGHVRPGASRQYGNELYPLPPLFAAIRRLAIPAFDLTHLRAAAPLVAASIPAAAPLPEPVSGDTISSYYGVDVRLHLHSEQPALIARCPGVAPGKISEATIHIADNRITRGILPGGKQLLVQAWVEIHRQTLLRNWENARRTGRAFPIAPLH